MKGFKEFLARGNVIDLAVAVIIGAAFTAIVNALVEGIFNPLIAAIFNADDIATATWQIGSISFGIGSVIAAIINFLLIAAVVYFVIVLPINKMNEAAYVRKHGHKPEDEEVPPSDNELLVEIRDLLAAQKGEIK
ncbi:large conductance mechanosensitive channel protein MscL [Gulosibacter molinativorax]|uniref:Large-conductance mechanosensitive channel n=1 Tax=Gulosibacter molinativorax TaxID=256821 RepID=A0ABT7C8K6_9MICO|nr:large conductance mechanosensitive channel protein MscL [Gulosibacter molinativorax]MDJ1371473.1 large conductance mechanosensitive channel protein MscL [Gulosibacter molinativorax]QUY62413.1 Large-conductance mechanosensitive channel [Gulosibacter molinativorax]